MYARSWLLAVMTAAATSGVAAQPEGRAPAVQAVVDCRAVADASPRLACFDRAVGAMVDAEKAGDLVTIDREQRRAARRQAFGLALPTLGFLSRGEKPEEVNSLSAKVTVAARNAEGKWVITLEGGAVWRQTDDNDLAPPRPGSIAKIRKGVLGSFFMNVDRQQAIRVQRQI
jgi:hypothetical protein